MEWFLKVVRDNYANFSGRARRKEYWNYILYQILFLIPLYAIGAWGLFAENLTITYIFGGLYFLLSLALVIPSIAVVVRRLHDTGRSGWWYFISLVPLVGIILLVWLVSDSEVGPNQWGEDPKAGEPGH